MDPNKQKWKYEESRKQWDGKEMGYLKMHFQACFLICVYKSYHAFSYAFSLLSNSMY